jgi:tyrosinase
MHGNVLFPVWHRAYLSRLEDALRSMKGCEQVALPYWDEAGERTATDGVPEIFLSPTFPLDGVNVKNPLYSYVFQAGVYDNLPPQPDQPVEDYSKPPGYETVRYPFSGLVGAGDVTATDVHNATLKSLGQSVTNGYLNSNVKNWLNTSITTNTGDVIYTGTRQKYAKCLEAPNYTVFSNTTSSTQWNEDHFGVQSWAAAGTPNPAPEAVVPLESPHNDMHLAVGGCEVPTFDVDNIEGANGDMGENDTAGFDPIFYFHHCFVDKTFWDWQQKWGATKSLDIISGYPGTNSVDSQGPTPGIPGNVWLTMETPLAPFKKSDGTTMIGNVGSLYL